MPINSPEDRETCDNTVPVTVQPLPPGRPPGAGVIVRGVRWHLDAVLSHAACGELQLDGGDPPRRRVLLWPFDRPVPADSLIAASRLRSVRLRTWAAAVGATIAAAVDPLTPRARAAAARIHPYQLPPALAVAGGTPPVLLADEVGLGMTIMAGWNVAGLLARAHTGRIIIVCPAGHR